MYLQIFLWRRINLKGFLLKGAWINDNMSRTYIILPLFCTNCNNCVINKLQI